MARPRVSAEAGFTLIELLVVVLIIAILAAIAIPIFFEQREKGWESQMRSSLKNAALAMETYGTENTSFAALDDQDIMTLAGQGFTKPQWAIDSPGYFTIEATATTYCLQARHSRLTESSAWRRSTYSSSGGAPQPMPDNCAELEP